MDLSQNHQICSKYTSWDLLSWFWKWRSLTLIFKVWPSFRLKELHSTLLLYTDLGRPRGATCPKRALVMWVIHPINSVHCKKYVKNVLNSLNLLFNVWCHCVEFGSVPETSTGSLTCTRGLTIDYKWWTHYRSRYSIIYMNTLYFRKRENGYEQCGKTAEIPPKQGQRPFSSRQLSDKGTGAREEKSKKS